MMISPLKPPPPLDSAPGRTTNRQQYKTKQTLYIIRHGVAYHNIPTKTKIKIKPKDDVGEKHEHTHTHTNTRTHEHTHTHTHTHKQTSSNNTNIKSEHQQPHPQQQQQYTYKYQHANVRDPKYTDSKLVLPKAHQQAKNAGRRLKRVLCNNHHNNNHTTITTTTATAIQDIGKCSTATMTTRIAATKETAAVTKNCLDCVFVSPLSRCMETAYFIMNELEEEDENDEHDQQHQQHQQHQHQQPTPKSPIKKVVPWICKEELREAYGIHYSDKRSCKSTLQHIWPNIQFDNTMTEEDEQWDEHVRETVDDVIGRIDTFLIWLSWNQLVTSFCNTTNSGSSKTNNNEKKQTVDEQEQHLLVVTHGVWMECLFKRYCPHILEEGGGRRVHNCDLYMTDLISHWERDCNTSSSSSSSSGNNNKNINEGKWTCNHLSLDNTQFIG